MNRQISTYHRALLFLVVSIVVRSGTYHFSSIDHDESTYLIIADQWLNGHLPWVDFVDIKPIGIYALFACGLKLLGGSFLSARILATIFIAGTALLVSLMLQRVVRNSQASLLAGLLYILCISLHQWSWTSNTEIFFTFFTAAGLWVFLSGKSPYRFLWMGLALGLGFCIKYHVLFDLTAFLIVYLIAHKETLQSQFRNLLLCGLGFFLPLAVWLGSYYALGFGPELYEVLVEMPSRYSASSNWMDRFNFIGEFYLVFLPISIMFMISIRRSFLHLRKRDKIWPTQIWILALVWPLMVWLAILLTGKPFHHYYIQQILPLVVVASLSLPDLLKYLAQRKKMQNIALAGGLVLLLAPPIHQWVTLSKKQDIGKTASARINQELEPGQIIFANTEHIVYLLCDRAPPTRFVHSSVFHKEELRTAFGVNLEEELRQVFAKKPKFCLVKPLKDEFLLSHLKSYQLLQTFPGGTELWGI